METAVPESVCIHCGEGVTLDMDFDDDVTPEWYHSKTYNYFCAGSNWASVGNSDRAQGFKDPILAEVLAEVFADMKKREMPDAV